MNEARDSAMQEDSSGSLFKKPLIRSEGDSAKPPATNTHSIDSSGLSVEEERRPTFWGRVRRMLCPSCRSARKPSAHTLPSIDTLSDEFEFVVEKLMIKKVPLLLCGTAEDLRQRFDERSYLASLDSESSVPKGLTELKHTGESMYSSESERQNISEDLSPVAYTSVHTNTEIPFHRRYENQEETSSFLVSSPVRNNYNSNISAPVVRPVGRRNAPFSSAFPVQTTTSTSFDSRSTQGTPQSDLSYYSYGLNPYSEKMRDSVSTETEHVACPRIEHNAPRQSICHDRPCKSKPVQRTTADYSPRAEEVSLKRSDINDPSEMPSVKRPASLFNPQESDTLSVKFRDEIDYPMHADDSKSNESDISSGSETSTLTTSKSLTPERRMSGSTKSLGSVKGSDILYEEDKPLVSSDDDEEEPVYVSVDGKRVFKTEEEAKHDFLNQFSSIFIDNLKDAIPKDPLTLRKKDKPKEQKSARNTTVRDNKSRISLPELLSEIGSTQVKSVSAGARKGGTLTDKPKVVTAQYVSEVETVRATSSKHGAITEDIESSEMLCTPFNTLSPAASVDDDSYENIVEVVVTQSEPEEIAIPTNTTVLTTFPQTQDAFKIESREKSIKGNPNETIPSSHMDGDTITSYSPISSNKKQTNNDIIPSNEAETSKKRAVSFIGSVLPNTVEDGNKRIKSPKEMGYILQQNQPRPISHIITLSNEENSLFSPTTSECIERLHEYPSRESSVPVHKKSNSSNKPDAEIVISPRNVQFKGSARLLDSNDSSTSVVADPARPIPAMPHNPCGFLSLTDALGSRPDNSREQKLVKTSMNEPPQHFHTYQLAHPPATHFVDMPATGTEYQPIAAGTLVGRNRLMSSTASQTTTQDTPSRTSIDHQTSQDLSTNTRDAAERGATLRWKIIIKHHRDTAEEQPPKKKAKDLATSNDVELKDDGSHSQRQANRARSRSRDN